MRLDKFLCEMNTGTRSQVKSFIRQGLVTVNGCTVKNPECKVDEEHDRIALRGELLSYRRFCYYMLNKPQGVVSATRDNTEKTVLDLLPPDIPGGTSMGGIFPVGRLDKDTEGLLLLTNDGELAHRMLSPKKHVDKTYLVGIARPLKEEEVKRLENGVDIGEKRLTQPASVSIQSETEILLTIHEGKFHQIKRMLEAVGNKVVSLKRISFGTLALDKALKTGEYRELTEQEVNTLHDIQNKVST